MMSIIVIMIGLGYAFFPEFVEYFNLDKQTQEAIMENNPGDAISRTLFLSSLALTSIACVAIGWFVIRTAPFAQFPHAIFLAVLLFIYFLQIAIADPPLKKSMTLAYMIAFPISILIGAKWAYDRGAVSDDTPAELLKQDAD